jgi:hypothetical protein
MKHQIIVPLLPVKMPTNSNKHSMCIDFYGYNLVSLVDSHFSLDVYVWDKAIDI